MGLKVYARISSFGTSERMNVGSLAYARTNIYGLIFGVALHHQYW